MDHHYHNDHDQNCGSIGRGFLLTASCLLRVSEPLWLIYVLLERRAHYFSETFSFAPRAIAHLFTLALLNHKQRVIDYFD